MNFEASDSALQLGSVTGKKAYSLGSMSIFPSQLANIPSMNEKNLVKSAETEMKMLNLKTSGN